MMRLFTATLALVLIPGAACSSASEADQQDVATASSPAQAATSASSSESVPGEESATQVGKAVALKVTRVVRGLDHPWDVQPIGQGRLLITERAGRLSVWKKGKLTDIPLPSGLVWAEGETGLMGLAVDPDFRDNRRFYTCLGGTPRPAVMTCGSSPGGSASRPRRPAASRR